VTAGVATIEGMPVDGALERVGRSGSSSVLGRAIFCSLLAHLGVIVAVLRGVSYIRTPELIGTPVDPIMLKALDVSLIPLSARDTVLPKGVPIGPQSSSAEQVSPPSPTPVSQPKVEPQVPLRREVEASAKPPVKQERKKKPEQEWSSSQRVSPERLKERHAERASPTGGSSMTPPQAGSSSATTSSVHSFGVPEGTASLEQARISYQDMVATRLARVKRYPERAIRRRMTGEGTIRLEISADGSLEAFQIVRSTEVPILDDELRAMVERASPFPAFPRDLKKNTLALIVPVAFRLG
jgi:protein TonB